MKDVLSKIWMFCKTITLADILIRMTMVASIITMYFVVEFILAERFERQVLMETVNELNGKVDDLSKKLESDTKEIKEEINKQINSLSTLFKITEEEFSSVSFSYRNFGKPKNRKEDYGQVAEKEIEFLYHKGGELLNYDEIYREVSYTMGRMPNIKSSEGFKLLVLETFMAETLFGKSRYEGAAKKGDLGLGQFRVTSAQDTLKWLGYKDVVNPNIKEAVMSFYDSELSLKDNLLTNVHFTIALVIQEYWRKVPNINQMDLANVVDRGILWKSIYNSNDKNAAGTVEKYVERVAYFHQQFKTGVPVKILAFK